MASILPDEVLNKLLCSLCKKYLSHPPTKIHKNGSTSCGRCNTNESSSPNSLYENVAKFSLFPCVNRFKGCNKLLHYKDVAQHEKVCKDAQYSCPLCSSDQQFSLLYLIEHYKNVHKEFVLMEPKCMINTNTMSENIYLYCDNSNNCLFFIEIRCTKDRLFLNASVSRSTKVVQRFRLNNILYEPDAVVLCSTLGGPKLQHIEVKIENEWNGILACDFLYDIDEKTVPYIALDNSVEEELMKEEPTYRKMPKIYLDNKIFSEKQRYKLSDCKSKLINEYDSSINIKLTCDICITYYWDISNWRQTKFEVLGGDLLYDYALYCHKYQGPDNIICATCCSYVNEKGHKLFRPTSTVPIFMLQFFCRYNCGMICSVWNLLEHETSCQLNLDENCVTNDVKKCFEGNSFNPDDKFIIGNVIKPFDFEVAFYPFAIFGPKPKTQDPKDVVSPEKVIYLVTNDGLKCKVYYKYEKRQFCVRVDHDYDTSRYLVKLCTFRRKTRLVDGCIDPRDYLRKIMFVEKFDYFVLDPINPLKTLYKEDGVSQYSSKTPYFVVNIKKILSSNLIL